MGPEDMNNQAENHQRRIAAEPSKELGHSFHTAQAECVAELGDAEITEEGREGDLFDDILFSVEHAVSELEDEGASSPLASLHQGGVAVDGEMILVGPGTGAPSSSTNLNMNLNSTSRL